VIGGVVATGAVATALFGTRIAACATGRALTKAVCGTTVANCWLA
jgi:hypothetical protein